MLKIYLGNMENAIYHPPTYFDNRYEDEWITDPLSVDMIRDIDKSVVLGSAVIDSPVLGKIPPASLSGGVKTLILINNEPERIFNASACGDNCAKWLLRISAQKDVTINLRHIMDFGEGQFEINILNTNQIVHNMQELVPVAGMLI